MSATNVAIKKTEAFGLGFNYVWIVPLFIRNNKLKQSKVLAEKLIRIIFETKNKAGIKYQLYKLI